jgi:YggT family protein
MQNALTFIFRTLLDLYIITFVLRFVLQWIRADVRNPLTQFILRVTNPLVIPVRRVVPPISGIDTATVLVILLLETLATAVLIQLACVGGTDPGQVVLIAILRLIHLLLRIYLVVILAYVVLSWISPGTYNPAANLLTAIAEPVLQPIRRLIPPIAGLDLSPLFAIIGIQAVTMLLPAGRAMAGLICSSVGQPL